MRILVVGAGSTGGFFGARLAQAGRDVSFLVRPKRAEQLQSGGLQVLSPHGDFTLAPRLVLAERIEEAYDLVILAVKAYALDAALDDLARAVGPQTMILPLLNGMRHVEVVRERFGNALIGGVCKINATLDEQGRIVQTGKMNDLAYGELDGTPSARLGQVDAQLRGAGFEAKWSDAIHREMWEKWLMLSSLGAVTCLARGTVGDVEAVPGGSAFALRVVDEALGIIRAVGVPPSDELVGLVRRMLTAPGSGQTSSMYRDLQAGHAIEAQQIVGDLLERGHKAGLDTPLLDAAYVNLCVYQRRQAAG